MRLTLTALLLLSVTAPAAAQGRIERFDLPSAVAFDSPQRPATPEIGSGPGRTLAFVLIGAALGGLVGNSVAQDECADDPGAAYCESDRYVEVGVGVFVGGVIGFFIADLTRAKPTDPNGG